jgi:hypothetical protein
LALKSLRKGWENETEQWQILIEFRLPKLTPETRTHRAVGASTVWRRQKPVAKHPSRSFVSIGLIDRRNHRLFQPLLYQRATSVLAPSQLSSPVRTILQPQKNTTVIMGKVTEPRGRAGRRCQ